MNLEEPAGSDLGSVTGLPLPAALEQLLRSLRPRGVGHRRKPDRTPLALLHDWRPRDVVADHLGFAVPTLSALRRRGQHERFAVSDAGAGEVGAGSRRGGEGAVRVVHVAEEQTLDLAMGRALQAGATILTLTYGDGVSRREQAPSTTRSPSSGDFTTVDVRGHLVGVQHLDPGQTRLAWVLRRPEVGGDVKVITGQAPRQAVRMLAACDVFGDGGST